MTTKTIGSAMLILSILCLISCSGKGNPSLPIIERASQDFLQNAASVFGPNLETYNNIDFDPNYHDVATCQIMTVGTGAGLPGSPWSGDQDDTFHGCAVVTLNRPGDNNLNRTFHPVFRWLNTDNYQTNGDARTGGPYLVTGWDVNAPDWKLSETDYRAVSCDAAYDPTGQILAYWEPTPTRTIELVVCYQVRNAPGQLNNTDWDIGVTALQWFWNGVEQPWDWYNDLPDRRYDVLFQDGGDEKDDTNPDIAYNHGDQNGLGAGDVYMAYSSGETGIDPFPTPHSIDVAYIKYRHFRRNPMVLGMPEYNAQTPDHNGHDPSIDVDWFQVPGFVWNVVAIAYTSQYQMDNFYPGDHHNGFHVCLTAFNTAWPDGPWPTFMSLRNPDMNFNNLNAGLPSVDIAPNINDIHNGVVAYTQETGSDGFGMTTRVFMTEIPWPLPNPLVHTPVDPVDTPAGEDLADGLYPSIAINQQLGPIVNASVTFMAQRAQDNILHPYAARVQIRPFIDQNWENIAALDLPNIFGNYNYTEIPFINPGMSTALVPGGNNNYWATWCDRTEMEPPPQTIWASWGFAG